MLNEDRTEVTCNADGGYNGTLCGDCLDGYTRRGRGCAECVGAPGKSTFAVFFLVAWAGMVSSAAHKMRPYRVRQFDLTTEFGTTARTFNLLLTQRTV